jgi:hypothetical protein
MNRALLLYNDMAHDDNALETDVMRFMAIIGIIFWLLFALVRNTGPLEQHDTSDGRCENAVTHPQHVSGISANQASDQPTQPVIVKKPVSKTPPASQAKVATQVQSKSQGLAIEFQSIADLYQLMSAEKVRIYCRIQSAGFDLIFETIVQGNGLNFRSASYLPERLWEIQAGSERNHFVNRLLAAYPSVGALTKRQVLVVFIDPEMDRRIAGLVEEAKATRRSGTITIDGRGQVWAAGEYLMGNER